ncbi:MULTISPECIES: preprotein translocase subunit SecG [Novosphingobium]|uniref:Protein-export membrane protein SecG n=1 Tax=Novosphingobium decolorationis TaxID=2698673 RepID=A0ABX8E127_9SPHN|nr:MULTISPECIES: preprotein translocase subunit SecG [Novosphingobium]MED5545440.1 preprotein translocase subunit SecG [Pseudomonadota bacterium]QVM82773.1 preprotein translocase subunit SecG [Novosphingobium decolorationis]GAM06556.1 protein translocase subunit secG [Novosphingobium sp. MBES04]
MFVFLTVVQALVAAALVGVILVQKSEGGGLGVGGGGNPGGLMSARGAADFLTRATSILAGLFVVLSILLAAMAVDANSVGDIDTSLQRGGEPAAQEAPADPLAGSAGGESEAGAAAAPANDDPLAGAAQQ